MALTCPIDLDVAGLRSEVQTMYSRVAAAPDGEFHFHRGRSPACYGVVSVNFTATRSRIAR